MLVCSGRGSEFEDRSLRTTSIWVRNGDSGVKLEDAAAGVRSAHLFFY